MSFVDDDMKQRVKMRRNHKNNNNMGTITMSRWTIGAYFRYSRKSMGKHNLCCIWLKMWNNSYNL